MQVAFSVHMVAFGKNTKQFERFAFVSAPWRPSNFRKYLLGFIGEVSKWE